MQPYTDQDLEQESIPMLQDRDNAQLYRVTMGQDNFLLLKLTSESDNPIHVILSSSDPDKVQLFQNLKDTANPVLDQAQIKQGEKEIDYQFIIKEEPPLTAVDLSESKAKDQAIFHLQVTAALIQINAWLNGLGSRLGKVSYDDLCLSQETGNILLQSLVYDPEEEALYYNPPLEKEIGSETAYLCGQLWNRLNKKEPTEAPNINEPPKILSKESQDMLEQLILGEPLNNELIYSQLRNEIQLLSAAPEEKKSGLKKKLAGSKEKEAKPKKRKKNLPPLPLLVAGGLLISLMLFRLVSCQAQEDPEDTSSSIETGESSQSDSSADLDFENSSLSELEERQEEEDAAREKELEEEREKEEEAAKEKEEAEQAEKEKAEKARQEQEEAANAKEKERDNAYNEKLESLEKRSRELDAREAKLRDMQNQLSKAQSDLQAQSQTNRQTQVDQAPQGRREAPAPKRSGNKVNKDEGFNVTPGAVNLSVNGKEKLFPNKTCIWLVDDPSIATVEQGNIIGHKAGQTTIKAQSLHGETYTITVTVK
ncbi:Ig-like domain-containing protein [Peptococcus simiae]|uniref:Ig-like domain-containing protein n=1 Tax=Peptococcus simiae TaxID=1643805 RepID=UPI00397E9AEE